jgi:hypothetical protein
LESPVLIDLSTGTAVQAGKITVIRSVGTVEIDGMPSGIVAGTDAAETLKGTFQNGGTFDGRGGDDSLQGSSVAVNTFIGGAGYDTLSGGDGPDRFVYRTPQEGGDVITDFKAAAGFGQDVLDIGSVLASGGYAGSTPIADGYLRIVASGNSTVVQVDVDGPGTGAEFETLATLLNVTPATLTADNFASTVDAGAIGQPTTGNGPVASGWSQSLTYHRGDDAVPLRGMVVADPDPNATLRH